MKTLLDASTLEEILNRLETLKPDSPAQWGKMNATQMLTHCSIILKMATGEMPQGFTLLGKLFGRYYLFDGLKQSLRI